MTKIVAGASIVEAGGSGWRLHRGWRMKSERLVAICSCVVVLSCSGTSTNTPDHTEIRIATDIQTECSSAQDCDDDNPCTVDTCSPVGQCVAEPKQGLECDDGNECTVGDNCNSDGICVGSTNLDCTDDNPCTNDSCDALQGCVFKNLNAEIDCDGTLCTKADRCEDGQCHAGELVACDDADPDDCMLPICDPKIGDCTQISMHPAGHPCKDGNPCTDGDSCNEDGACQAGSVHECVAQHPCKTAWCNEQAKEGTNPCILEWKAPGVGCTDGDSCTDADSCLMVDVGPALKCTGVPVDCNDSNPCSLDTCVEETGCTYQDKNDGSPCNFGADSCGQNGTCLSGECIPSTQEPCNDDLACTVDKCIGGQCFHEPVHGQCDDQVDCTVDTCSPESGCVNSPEHGLCDDGLFCNGNETCSVVAGCQGGIPPVLDDGIVCTVDLCDETGDFVLHTPDSAVCDDFDPCTGSETCSTQLGCVPGIPFECDDSIGCTEDHCAAMIGCTHIPDNTLCSDENICNGDESCHAELGCVQGESLDCNDNLACTVDDCDPFSGCSHAPEHQACSDGQYCNGEELCSPQLGCQEGLPPELPDGIACTVDACDEELDKIVHFTIDGDCDDGDVCTGVEHCDADVGCVSGPALNCNDDVDCTQDQCNSVTGCSFVPNNLLCSDNIGCTTDMCDLESGCIHELDHALCDDDYICTSELCDKQLGCVYSTNDESCEDGLFCNGVEACLLGKGCVAGLPPELDDQVDCTQDSCNEELDKVVHSPDHSKCDDQDVCTGQESCDANVGCVGGVPLICADEIDCTTDSCTPDEGCIFTPVDDLCADNDVCNGLETCDLNTGCIAGSPLTCMDEFDCTSDKCLPAQGCIFEPDDEKCNDGSVCNGQEICSPNSGCQSGLPLDCNDAVQCTDDGCDPKSGCVHTPSDDFCDDQVDCTLDSCDSEDGCVHEPAHSVCDDELLCTEDVCLVETGCTHDLAGGWCLIEGACYEDGEAHQVDTCLACLAGEQLLDWSANDGVACDDSDSTTTDDVCNQGTCAGLPDPDEDGIANEGYLLACIGGETESCNDNCPDDPNPTQEDDNNDGTGNACTCYPDCDGKECGEDGCGGSCGACENWDACKAGACVSPLQCKWSLSVGGPASDIGYAVDESSDGQVWLSGNTESTQIDLDGSDLEGPGVFYAAFSPEGALQHSKSIVGAPGAPGGPLSCSGEHTVLVGSFHQPVNLGEGILSPSGGSDALVSSYDMDGQYFWSTTFNGVDGDFIDAAAAGLDGEVVVSGAFTSPTLYLGATQLQNKSGGNDIFAARLTDAGDLVWAHSFGGWGRAPSIVSTNFGEVILMGQFAASTIEFGATSVSRKGQQDVFIVKLGQDGHYLWSSSAAIEQDSWQLTRQDVAVDSENNVLATGVFMGTLDFGQNPLHAQNRSIFLVKFGPDGTILWAKSIGGAGNQYSNAVAVDSQDNIYIAGYFKYYATIGDVTLYPSGEEDVLVVKCSPDGSVLFAADFGTVFNGAPSYGEAFSIAIADNNDVLLAGAHLGQAMDFGCGPLLNEGMWDAFLVRFSQ